jgi:hypothetical protein
MSPRALLTLTMLRDAYAVSRLDAAVPIPPWATEGEFVCVARSSDELSIVCPELNVPAGITCERGWRALKCEGPLDYELTGIVASLAVPLADAGVPIFPIATHNTDYILVKERHLETAVNALIAYGHHVRV